MKPMQTQPDTLRKIAVRIIPLVVVCYFMTFLDRVNVGVAGVQMNADIGLTATAFGIGSGLFFITYILFEVPSNVLMHRVGARVWIPRILITIGVVAAASALIQGPTSFYLIRLLLGVVEAGAAPAFVLYLTFWFPASVRPRAYACYFLALPLATIIGAPLSGLVLGLDGVGGLRGWQWVFIFPGVLSVVLGIASYFLFVDGPAKAKWLTPQERATLAADLDAEAQASAAQGGGRVRHMLRPQFLALAVLHLAGNIANYTLSFFLPLIIKDLGASDFSAAALSALPYLAGAIALLYFGRRAARSGCDWVTLTVPFTIGVVGFAVAGLAEDPVVVLAGLCLGAVGGLGYLPAFWNLMPAMFSGVVLAASIAAINAFANLGGLIGPSLMGLPTRQHRIIQDRTAVLRGRRRSWCGDEPCGITPPRTAEKY